MEYEDRELILELFPGTSPDLLPIGEILYYRDEEGRVVILDKGCLLYTSPSPRD